MKTVRRQRLLANGARAKFSESENLEGQSEVDIRRETRPLGSLPIIVLTAGGDFAGQGYSAKVERNLLDELHSLHSRLAALSSAGSVVLVPGADHVIQASHPDAVVDAIRTIINGTGDR